MVEILMLGRFTDLIAGIAQSKGYRPGNYRLGALILWCLGEVCGLYAGFILLPYGGDLPSLLLMYGCALLGAGIGAGAAYWYMRRLK